MKWYDYLNFAWTVNKYLWEKLRPQRPQEPGRPPQMSCYGRALPLAFGKQRLTGNIVYIDDTGTGVAGAVFAKVMLAICEGEIAGVDRVWNGKDVKASPGEYLLSVLTGTRPTQTAWSELPAGKDSGYAGIALVVAKTIKSAGGSSGRSLDERCA